METCWVIVTFVFVFLFCWKIKGTAMIKPNPAEIMQENRT